MELDDERQGSAGQTDGKSGKNETGRTFKSGRNMAGKQGGRVADQDRRNHWFARNFLRRHDCGGADTACGASAARIHAGMMNLCAGAVMAILCVGLAVLNRAAVRNMLTIGYGALGFRNRTMLHGARNPHAGRNSLYRNGEHQQADQQQSKKSVHGISLSLTVSVGRRLPGRQSGSP
jgi:hypothetical protein